MAYNISPYETGIWKIVQAIIAALRGASNSVGVITLAVAPATTTVVTQNNSLAAINVSKDMQVFLSPKTANAAAALATTYISAVGQGTFTITHASSAQVDRTFGWKATG